MILRIHDEGSKTMNNVLVMEKEINGCKVNVFCPTEKTNDCKEAVLFLLTESFEKSMLPTAENAE